MSIPVLTENNETILKDERPSARYGVGILFPDCTRNTQDDLESNVLPLESGTQVDLDAGHEDNGNPDKRNTPAKLIEKSEKISTKDSQDDSSQDTDSGDLRLSNRRRQQSMGAPSSLTQLTKGISK